MGAQRRKQAVAWLSVASNSALMIGKLIVGLFIGSVSVISEGIHSGVDLLASIIAVFAVSTSHKPADREHPFGHGKVENISGAVEGALIFLAAGWIIYEATRKLMHHEPMDAPAWGVGIMLVSVVMNLLVSGMLFKVGKETDSIALQADAWHLRTDVWTSFGVMAGLVIILIGRFFNVDLWWVDPVAAILVAMLIIRAAWKLTASAACDLLDVSLPRDEEESICELLAQERPYIFGFHHLRTRKAGATRFVEFHLKVQKDLSVQESHDMTDALVAEIKERFSDVKVTIHVEPCDGNCTDVCREGCLIKDNIAIRSEDGSSPS